MYEIIASPHWNDNYSAKKTQYGDPCAVCGKRIKPENQKHFVRLFWGTTAVTEAEATEIIAREGEGGDLLYYPVGSDCLRRQPELKPYVKDAAAAQTKIVALLELDEREHKQTISIQDQINDLTTLTELLTTLKPSKLDDILNETDAEKRQSLLRQELKRMDDTNRQMIAAFKSLAAHSNRDTTKVDTLIKQLEANLKEDDDEDVSPEFKELIVKLAKEYKPVLDELEKRGD